MKNKWTIIGLIGTIIGFIATLIGGWASDHKMEAAVDAAVERRLNKG